MKRVRSDSTDSEVSTEYSQDEGEDKFDADEIEGLAEQLYKNIPRDKVMDFLHTLTVSKNILHWNSHEEMMYHQRRIPVTSMVELIKYAMLPYNRDVKPPRGLKTFTEGLAEIGIDKNLIRDKILLANLVAREPDEEDNEESEIEMGEETQDQEEDSSDQVSESSESTENSDEDSDGSIA